MTSSRLLAASTALLLVLLTGCIHSRKTVYTDPVRTTVSFESEKAGRVFYEALSQSTEGRQRTESKAGVHLIVIDVETETVTGPNQFFNEAVARCDSNGDGTITELEANLFASMPPVHHRK